MSKNLTRKGLALGAVVALGSSLFAGTPASAATAITLDTAFGTSGTTQNGVLGKYFSLKSTLTGGAAGELVKFYVEGVTAADITAKTRLVTDVTADAGTATYSTTSGTVTALVTTANKVAAVSNANKQATIIPNDTYTAGSIVQAGISLDAASLDATTTIKVTAFIDNGVTNNKPGDAGEVASAPVTITFHKGSTLTATPTLKAFTLGSAVKATVAVSNSVNVEQFRAAADGGHAEYPFAVVVKEDGVAQSSANAIWNTTDKEFVASSVNAAAGKVYGATATINGTNSASATVATATAGEVASFTSLGINAGTSYRATRSNVNSSTQIIRSGAGSITAKAVVTVDSGKAKAGQTITFIVSEKGANTIHSGASITAGGKTLTNAASADIEKISVTAVTNADGEATLPISYTGIKNGNTLFVDATANGSSGLVDVAQFELAAQDSVAQGLIDIAASASNAANAGFASNGALAQGSAVREFVKGSAVSVAYRAVDQFGQTPTGDHRVVFSGGSSINYTANVAVGSDGTVSFSGTDNNSAATTYTITATLQKKDDNGDYQAIANQAITRDAAIQIVAAANAPATLSVTANATVDVVRSLSTLVAGNAGLEQGSVSRTVNGGTYLGVTVYGADGSVKDGAEVTFSAPGVLFRAGEVYGLGSLTVLTTGSGVTGNVYAYSNNTGKQTITVTSGAATKTQVISFAAAANTTGSAWTVDAPVRVTPGTTLKVSAVLKDKYGVAVETASGKVKVVYTGAGFVTATLPTTTDADGVVSFNVLLGASDVGTATVKLIYAGANGTLEETTSNDDVVATATIAIGAAPASSATAAVSGSTGKFFVSATNAAAKKVVVKVAGKFAASFTGTAAKKSVAVKATKGSKKVTVFVGGKLVATKTVTVK